ncbi:PorT family protein, partial [Bacteroides fragilis]
MKRIVLLFISIWIAFAAYGEDNHKKERHPDDRKINVGIRG